MDYEYRITLSHNNEPFLDTLKAYCILWVVFAHVFPYLEEIGYPVFGAIQVPLFFIIQSFHYYKKKTLQFSIKKLAKRIIIPFALVICIQLLIKSLGGGNIIVLNMIKDGGFGPGSYYPWCYLQMVVLLTLFRSLLLSEKPLAFKIVIIVSISAIAEWLSEVIFQESIYRLSAFRYIIYILYGYIWAQYGITLSKSTIILSLMSLIFIILLSYFNMRDDLFIDKYCWGAHIWICSCWSAFLFPALLYFLHQRLYSIVFFKKIITTLSKSSYEIFLSQMLVLSLFHFDTLENLLKDQDVSISREVLGLIYIVSAFSISLYVGIFWRHCLTKIQNKNTL